MNNYFESTAKFIRTDENGHEKKVTETYLLDAVSFTEAEARTYKELQEMVSGEFITWSIKRTNISEIIPCAVGDRWYKAKVSFITVDEETGKEKRTSQHVLVYSDSVKNAYDQIIDATQKIMANFEISAISESKILDVFPFDGAEKVIPKSLKPIEVKSVFVKETGEAMVVFNIAPYTWQDCDSKYTFKEEELEFIPE